MSYKRPAKPLHLLTSCWTSRAQILVVNFRWNPITPHCVALACCCAVRNPFLVIPRPQMINSPWLCSIELRLCVNRFDKQIISWRGRGVLLVLCSCVWRSSPLRSTYTYMLHVHVGENQLSRCIPLICKNQATQHGRPQEFFERGSAKWTDKNNLFLPPKTQSKLFAIFLRFRLNWKESDASAEVATENFFTFPWKQHMTSSFPNSKGKLPQVSLPDRLWISIIWISIF